MSEELNIQEFLSKIPNVQYIKKEIINMAKNKGFIPRDNILPNNNNYDIYMLVEIQMWLMSNLNLIITVLHDYETTNRFIYEIYCEKLIPFSIGPNIEEEYFSIFEYALETGIFHSLKALELCEQ